MSALTARTITYSSIQTIDDLFTLLIFQNHKAAYITMRMLLPIVNTSSLPFTYSILERSLPTILSSKCFNKEHLPFSIEVRQTEIGHLFEHILLEYLCELRIQNGSDEAMFRGNTAWNWLRDPEGTFHITISAGSKDADIFPIAIEKTVNILKLILQNTALDSLFLTTQPQRFID